MRKTAWIIRLGAVVDARPYYLRRTFDGALTWTRDVGAADPAPTCAEAEKRAARSISGASHAVEVDVAFCRAGVEAAESAAATRRHRRAAVGKGSRAHRQAFRL